MNLFSFFKRKKKQSPAMENITSRFHLNDCVIHHCQPTIFKMCSYSETKILYSATCRHADCGHVTDSFDTIGLIWNQWNPKFLIFPGDKVWVKAQKRPFVVRASDSRYAICTKPLNFKKTVLYTIIDLHQGVRGTENLIFCMGFETDQLCNEALIRLQNGDTEISHRNRIPLDIIRIEGTVQ